MKIFMNLSLYAYLILWFNVLELFSEKDVSGRKLYGFQTPTKRNSMMIKANQCRTPETPKSFKTLPVLKIVLEKIVSSPENQVNKDVDTKGTAYPILKKFWYKL